MARTRPVPDELFDTLKFDPAGLIPAIVLDAGSGKPLMFAWMNRDALRRSIETGTMHYWSRSRGKLWLKGESSGHVQTVREVRVDCDGDALVFKVDQKGGACHTGYRSCFYRKLENQAWVQEGERVFDPAKVYDK